MLVGPATCIVTGPTFYSVLRAVRTYVSNRMAGGQRREHFNYTGTL
jgi:hypothetical protein